MPDETDSLWARLKQTGRLFGIIGIATAQLALSYCTHSPTKPDSKRPDMRVPDAGVTDLKPATLDNGVKPVDKGVKPDTRLWDVLCE